MNCTSEVMIYKKPNHWMAKLFVQIRDGNESSYILCRYLLLYENGGFEIINHDTLGLNSSEINIQTTLAKEKLANHVWEELKEKGHWVTFRYRIPPLDLLEYITRALKIELTDSIRIRISNQTNEMDFYNYIANSKPQKSIRKALYLSHSKQMRQQRMYNPKADFIICRSFDDPSLIVAMINCPIKNDLFKEIKEEHAITFFRWLQKFYTASSIVKSITLNIVNNTLCQPSLWIDVLHKVETITITAPYGFSQFFRKSHMNTEVLHNELIRIHRLIDPNQKTYNYIYTKAQLNIEGNYFYLKFLLPKSTSQLDLWGHELINCFLDSNSRINNNEILIIGVYINEELTYTIEYANGVISETSGKFNSEVPTDDLMLIHNWVDTYNSNHQS